MTVVAGADRTALHLLVLTSSPVLRIFFADLARRSPPSTGLAAVQHLDFVMECAALTSDVLAEASAAVVDTNGEEADLTVAMSLCRKLRTERPDIPILAMVYTAAAITPWHVEALLEGDLAGLLDLAATAEDVLWALSAASRGDTVVCMRRTPAHAVHVREMLNRRLSGAQSSPQPWAPANLTAREREVLILLAEGASDKEVAAQLGLRPSTVESYVQRVEAKLGARTRFQLGAATALCQATKLQTNSRG